MRWWQKECCSMREQKLLSCATTVLIPEGFAAGSLQRQGGAIANVLRPFFMRMK